jgi:hypothetical protein
MPHAVSFDPRALDQFVVDLTGLRTGIGHEAGNAVLALHPTIDAEASTSTDLISAATYLRDVLFAQFAAVHDELGGIQQVLQQVSEALSAVDNQIQQAAAGR